MQGRTKIQINYNLSSGRLQLPCDPSSSRLKMQGGTKNIQNNSKSEHGSSPALVWWLAYLVAVNLCCTATGLNSEGFALLAFKNATTNDPRNALGNWNASDDTPCSWNGVSCDGSDRVVSLTLSRQRLEGRIPAELGNLAHLRELNLHSNAFSGPIPPQFFDALSLRTIYFFNNNLSGILQPVTGQLTQLQHFSLANNGFVGEIPVELSNLQSLVELILSGNQFAGHIPDGLGNNLQMLQTLDLSSNQLSGGIPADLGNLSSLRGVLALSQNELIGSIPATLANLPLAVRIDVRSNNLSGPVHPIFAEQNRGIEADQNSGLCGAPLANSCAPPPSSAAPLLPVAPRRGLSRNSIIAIVVGDVAGILLLILICECCLRRRLARLFRSSTAEKEKEKRGVDTAAANNSSEMSFSTSTIQEAEAGWICFTPSRLGSEDSIAIEPGELIKLDKDVKFALDDLLRASAYVLGKSTGGAGVVYKAMMEEGLTVAVRRLGEGGAHEYKEFESQVKLIGKIRHPNVVSLRAYYWAVDEKLLVYDYIPNGSLAMALHAPTREPLNWAKRLKIARGCARGLAYIHACGIGRNNKLVHKDIKPSNILLDGKLEVKISDMGLPRLRILARGLMSKSKSTEADGTGSNLPRTSDSFQHGGEIEDASGRRDSSSSNWPHKTCPSSCYYPPESAVDKRPTQAWDVYAFGVLLLELLTGRSPVTLQGNDSGRDLVSWVRQTVEERKPVTDVLDTQMSAELLVSRDVQREFTEMLQIALECTVAPPEKRPPLSDIAPRLEQISKRLEISFKK